jgi:hypothetical protein
LLVLLVLVLVLLLQIVGASAEADTLVSPRTWTLDHPPLTRKKPKP